MAFAAIAAFASCSSSTDSSGASIIGSWVTDSAASPTGHYVRQLIFTKDSRFFLDFRSYGLYEGQQPDALSGYGRTAGSFTVNGDRVIFEPSWYSTWDFSFGRDAPQTVYAPYPFEHFYDDARVSVDGSTLTLTYTAYPDDAPVTTTETYQRGQ
jgi:hypothetical protein